MKINRIENMTLDNMTVKKDLTEADYVLLKDTLKSLVKTYAFFEHDKEFDNDNLFVCEYGSELPRVSIAGYEEEDGILIGDYFVRSAFLTEKEQLIIIASPIRQIDEENLLVDPDEILFFLVTDLNNGCTTSALYDCFINDVPTPTVTI